MLYKQNIGNSGAVVTVLYQAEGVDKLDREFFSLTIYKFGHGPNLIKRVTKIYNNNNSKSKLTWTYLRPVNLSKAYSNDSYFQWYCKEF